MSGGKKDFICFHHDCNQENKKPKNLVLFRDRLCYRQSAGSMQRHLKIHGTDIPKLWHDYVYQLKSPKKVCYQMVGEYQVKHPPIPWEEKEQIQPRPKRQRNNDENVNRGSVLTPSATHYLLGGKVVQEALVNKGSFLNERPMAPPCDVIYAAKDNIWLMGGTPPMGQDFPTPVSLEREGGAINKGNTENLHFQATSGIDLHHIQNTLWMSGNLNHSGGAGLTSHFPPSPSMQYHNLAQPHHPFYQQQQQQQQPQNIDGAFGACNRCEDLQVKLRNLEDKHERLSERFQVLEDRFLSLSASFKADTKKKIEDTTNLQRTFEYSGEEVPDDWFEAVQIEEGCGDLPEQAEVEPRLISLQGAPENSGGQGQAEDEEEAMPHTEPGSHTLRSPNAGAPWEYSPFFALFVALTLVCAVLIGLSYTNPNSTDHLATHVGLHALSEEKRENPIPDDHNTTAAVSQEEKSTLEKLKDIIKQNFYTFIPDKESFKERREKNIDGYLCSQEIWLGDHCEYLIPVIFPVSITRHSVVCCPGFDCAPEGRCCGNGCHAEEESINNMRTLMRAPVKTRLKEEL